MHPIKDWPCVACGAKDRNKRGDCNPCHRAQAARYYRSQSPEKRRAVRQAWVDANPDKVKAAKDKYNAQYTAGEKKEKLRSWRNSNYERVLYSEAKKRRNEMDFNIKVEDIVIPDVCP